MHMVFFKLADDTHPSIDSQKYIAWYEGKIPQLLDY